MSECWRIQAKHATVCPLCRGYIKVGDWIVKEDGQRRWSHSVCPERMLHVDAEEQDPSRYRNFVLTINKEGVVEVCPQKK
jgi:hypothetical protein